MVQPASSAAETSPSASVASRKPQLLSEHDAIAVTLAFATAGAILAIRSLWKQKKTKNRKLIEIAKRDQEEKLRQVEEKWGLDAKKVLLASTKPVLSVANVDVSAQHNETPVAGPSSRHSSSTIERSVERKRRGRNALKDTRKQNRTRSKTDTKQSPLLHERSLSQTRSGLQYLEVILPETHEQTDSSRLSSRTRSASSGLEDETPRPSSSDHTSEHNPLETYCSSSPYGGEDAVNPTIPHVRDTTITQYAVSTMDDTETRSSMSDSVSSLGMAPAGTSSQTSDNEDASDSPRPSPPTEMPSKSSSSRSSSPSVDSTVEVTSAITHDTTIFPISQPVPSHVQAQLPWLSKEAALHDSHAKSPSAGSEGRSWDNSRYRMHGVHRSRSPPSLSHSLSRSLESPAQLPFAPPTPPSFTEYETSPPNASLHTEVNSYKRALSAAQLRQDRMKSELERSKQECDRLKKELAEESERRRAAEAELLQMSVYSFPTMPGAGMHAQVQHMPIPHFAHASGYPYQSVSTIPHSFHPPFTPQHAASPPTSAPMPLTLPFSPPLMAGFPMAPIPYPQQAEASNVSSPAHPLQVINFAGPLNSEPGGEGEEEDEYISPLAEAILKRPETMRSPSRSSAPTSSRSVSGCRSGPSSGSASRASPSRVGSRSASVAGGATREGVFTFPSLSELGNPQPRSNSPLALYADESDEREQCSTDAGIGAEGTGVQATGAYSYCSLDGTGTVADESTSADDTDVTFEEGEENNSNLLRYDAMPVVRLAMPTSSLTQSRKEPSMNSEDLGRPTRNGDLIAFPSLSETGNPRPRRSEDAP